MSLLDRINRSRPKSDLDPGIEEGLVTPAIIGDDPRTVPEPAAAQPRTPETDAPAQTDPGEEEWEPVPAPALRGHTIEEMALALAPRVSEAIRSLLAQPGGVEKAEERLRPLVEECLREAKLPMAETEAKHLTALVRDEVLGYGPLEGPLNDPSVTQIIVDGPHRIQVERYRKLEHLELSFRDEAQLGGLIQRIAALVGARIDPTVPRMAVTQPDGSKIEAVIPPLVTQPMLNITKAGRNPMAVAKLRRQQQTISDRTAFYELEYRMLDLLLPDIDQDLMARQSEVLVARELQEMILTLLERQSVILTREDRLQLIEDLVDEVVGYGPIDKLLKDPSVDEVMVNGPRHVFVERQGRLHRVDRRFRDNDHVITIAQKIVSAIGRRVDESAPMVDARLPDGSRVNAIVPPLAIDGPTITVRKFGKGPMSADDLVRHGTMTTKVMEFLRAAVRSRLNIIISGGTGSGKTSTLNVLSSFIGESERIITIEDAAELRLQQGHVVRLESRPPNIEGRGQVTIRDLVRNALRMRPDRIVVGEVRGGETLDMLQAMNTGHEGSMTTLHANSPREALSRLEVMSLMAGMDLPLRAVREQMCAAINLVVHQARLRDGSRRITQITEVQGMEGDTPVTQDIFIFRQTGMTPEGRVAGDVVPTGIRPKVMEEIDKAGIQLPVGFFDAPGDGPGGHSW